MSGALTVGIRGAGLAGMACARRLRELLPGLSIAVFDTRPRLPHPARTFCFFDRWGDALGAPVAKRWRVVRLRGPGLNRSISCGDAPYTCVRGEDFFAQALARLEAQGVLFQWECPHVTIEPQTLVVGGARHRFDVVVDAAFSPEGVEPCLWQSFGGVVVETERPTFDPHEATLMDLLPSSPESPVAFVYVLPFSSTTALVEHTTFSPVPRAEAEHREGCRTWLRSRGIDVYRELSHEFGRIPMGLPSFEATPWPVLGTVGGGVRAGTGFGFVGIDLQARRLAGDLARRHELAPGWRFNPTPAVLRCGDALFLRALRSSPSIGRDLLEGLLRRGSADDLIAFLSGGAGVRQACRVMAGVPKSAMVRALCSVG